MPLTIDDDLLRQVGLTPEELRLELAIHLFREDRMTLGQAGTLAGLPQLTFQRELAKRSIPVHYDVEEFESDLDTLRDTGLL